MNSQFNMCESNSNLLNSQTIYVILSIVTCIINYMILRRHVDKLDQEIMEQNEEEKENDDDKNWEIYFKSDKHKKKDVNKWYIIPCKYICRYKGEWKDGLANGKGIREVFGSIDIDHSVYEGEFKDGKPDGYGKQTYDITRDEEKFAPYYEGEFKNGQHHGFGTYYYGCSSYRRGNLVDGKFIGRGIYYNAITNRSWMGIYEDDKRGDGVWVDGEKLFDEPW